MAAPRCEKLNEGILALDRIRKVVLGEVDTADSSQNRKERNRHREGFHLGGNLAVGTNKLCDDGKVVAIGE